MTEEYLTGRAAGIAQEIVRQRLGLGDLPPGALAEVTASEFRFAQVTLANRDARLGDFSSLSHSDRSIAARTIGLLIAARVCASFQSGSGLVTQVKSAEGSQVNFSTVSASAPQALLDEAWESLSAISFLNAQRKANAAQAANLGSTTSRGRTFSRPPVIRREGEGGAAFFGSEYLDIFTYPFGAAYGDIY